MPLVHDAGFVSSPLRTSCSIRSYKTKLDAWGYWKNHKHRTACSASRVERDTDVDDALLTGPLDGAVSSGEYVSVNVLVCRRY